MLVVMWLAAILAGAIHVLILPVDGWCGNRVGSLGPADETRCNDSRSGSAAFFIARARSLGPLI